VRRLAEKWVRARVKGPSAQERAAGETRIWGRRATRRGSVVSAATPEPPSHRGTAVAIAAGARGDAPVGSRRRSLLRRPCSGSTASAAGRGVRCRRTRATVTGPSPPAARRRRIFGSALSGAGAQAKDRHRPRWLFMQSGSSNRAVQLLGDAKRQREADRRSAGSAWTAQAPPSASWMIRRAETTRRTAHRTASWRWRGPSLKSRFTSPGPSWGHHRYGKRRDAACQRQPLRLTDAYADVRSARPMWRAISQLRRAGAPRLNGRDRAVARRLAAARRPPSRENLRNRGGNGRALTATRFQGSAVARTLMVSFTSSGSLRKASGVLRSASSRSASATRLDVLAMRSRCVFLQLRPVERSSPRQGHRVCLRALSAPEIVFSSAAPGRVDHRDAAEGHRTPSCPADAERAALSAPKNMDR
jgi:hypothetical protein